MREGFLKEWYLGTLAHYLCDYCCLAHDEEYYKFYRHRVYEVQSQKYFLRTRKSEGGSIYCLEESDLPVIGALSGDIRNDVSMLIDAYVGKLHERIDDLHSESWFWDRRIMDLDIRYAHVLTAAVIGLLKAKRR